MTSRKQSSSDERGVGKTNVEWSLDEATLSEMNNKLGPGQEIVIPDEASRWQFGFHGDGDKYHRYEQDES